MSFNRVRFYWKTRIWTEVLKKKKKKKKLKILKKTYPKLSSLCPQSRLLRSRSPSVLSPHRNISRCWSWLHNFDLDPLQLVVLLSHSPLFLLGLVRKFLTLWLCLVIYYNCSHGCFLFGAIKGFICYYSCGFFFLICFLFNSFLIFLVR